jgi:putative copper resistance protein D
LISQEAALIAWRFLHFALAMLLFGACGFVTVLVPWNLARDIERRLRWVIVVAAVITVAMTFLQLPLEAAVLGDGWSDALAPSALFNVLTATSFGGAWEVEGVAALLVVASLAIVRKRPIALVLTSGLLLATVSLTGHAVMQEGWLGVAHRVNDVACGLGGCLAWGARAVGGGYRGPQQQRAWARG